MKLYDNMLIAALTLQAVPKETLIAMNSCRRFTQEMLSQAITNNHLRESVSIHKKRNKKIIERYYSVTPKGVRFLMTKSNSATWLNCLSAEGFTPGRNFPNTFGSANVGRVAKVAEAALMSKIAGADMPLLTTLYANRSPSEEQQDTLPVQNEQSQTVRNDIAEEDTDDIQVFSLDDDEDYPAPANDGKVTLYNSEEQNEEYQKGTRTNVEVINAILRADCADALNEKAVSYNRSWIAEGNETESDYIRFIDSFRVKNMLAKTNTVSAKNDFKKSRITGLIESRHKILMTYSVHEVGLRWFPWAYKSELAIYMRWNSSWAFAERAKVYEDGPAAVLFVKNKRQFAQLYRDDAGVRKENETLGQGLRHFHVVPKTYLGGQYLRWLMLTDMNRYESEIIKQAVESESFEVNMSFRTNQFPLKDRGGTMYCLGVGLDIIALQSLRSVITTHPDKAFGVICFPWQEEYYADICPEVSIVTITDA